MAKKAKNAPPWTRKKLFKYRTERRRELERERKEQKAVVEDMEKVSNNINRVTVGVKGWN